MKTALSFVAMAIVGWAIWKLLARQEQGDHDFQRRLDADDRRARANREASARERTSGEPPARSS
jgi:hypothetical protein